MENKEKGLSEIKKFKAMDYVQLALILGLLSVSLYSLSKAIKE